MVSEDIQPEGVLLLYLCVFVSEKRSYNLKHDLTKYDLWATMLIESYPEESGLFLPWEVLKHETLYQDEEASLVNVPSRVFTAV